MGRERGGEEEGQGGGHPGGGGEGNRGFNLRTWRFILFPGNFIIP